MSGTWFSPFAESDPFWTAGRDPPSLAAGVRGDPIGRDHREQVKQFFGRLELQPAGPRAGRRISAQDGLGNVLGIDEVAQPEPRQPDASDSADVRLVPADQFGSGREPAPAVAGRGPRG